MASFVVWLEVLSYVKALFEAITLGKDVREQYQNHRRETCLNLLNFTAGHSR